MKNLPADAVLIIKTANIKLNKEFIFLNFKL